MFESLLLLGNEIRELVIKAARLVADDSAPGLVVLILLLLLLLSVGIFWFRIQSQQNAIKWLFNLIKRYETPQDFTENVFTIDQEVRKRWGVKNYDHLVRGWLEYRETLVHYGEGDQQHLKNSVRPSTFLNLEDLQFSSGFWRIVPGLFVTVGLFLTFLGLVAALSVVDIAGASPEVMRIQLDTLLKTAAAKFIMSLTGLFCSIVFNVVLRARMGGLESDLHGLCAHVEYLLKFISHEDIAIDQLKSSKEQKEHFRTIGMEMVAELGRPLREELPNVISKSIADAMAPMVEKVAKVGTDGVGNMVEDLSSKFSSDVTKALESASGSIEIAGRKIGELAVRMDQSSGNLNSEITRTVASLAETLDRIADQTTHSVTSTSDAMSKGAEQFLKVMSESLEDIKINTGAGAQAIGDAASEMRLAAETFKEELSKAAEAGVSVVGKEMSAAGNIASEAISGAGNSVLKAFGDTAQNIVASSNEMSSRMSEGLLNPLDQIHEKLTQFNESFSSSSQDFRRLSEGIRITSDASTRAAENFKSAAADLSNVANPIRSSVDRLGDSIANLENSTQKSSSALLNGISTIVEASEKALNSAVDILKSEQEGLQASLEGMQEVVKRMRGQGDRMDDLDEKLGAAFELYADHVSKALGAMSNHMRKLSDEMTPALDVMREVVEQAERFIPESRN